MAKVSKRKWNYKGEERTAYVVRYFDQGGVRRQGTFEKFKQADAFRLRVENELANKTHIPASKTVTMAELSNLFLEEVERRHRIKDRMTGSTRMHYRCIVQKHIAPRFGTVLVTELSADMVQQWLDDLCLKFKRGSVAAYRACLDVMLKFAVRRHYVGRNVIVEGGVRVAGGERKRLAIPSLADLQRVLAALEKPVKMERHGCFLNRRAVIGLALFTSLRRGEVAGLQWENVDLERGLLAVEHSLSFYDGLKTPKTWAGIRTNALAPYVLSALQDLWVHQGKPKTGYVIQSLRGRQMRPSQIWDLWRALAKNAGVATENGTPLWRFHDFRHAAASLLIAEGVNPLHIKTFMGHASIKTTLGVYGHLFPEDSKVPAAVTAIANRLVDGARAPQNLASD